MAVGGGGGGSAHTSTNTQSTANQNNSKNPKSNCDKSDTASATTAHTDPIDTSSGSKIEEVTDFAEPGEMGLAFVRYYNSRYTCLGSATCTTSMGSWTTSLDYRLEVDCTQVAPPSTTVSTVSSLSTVTPEQVVGGGNPQPCGPAYYYRPDGSVLTFTSTTPFFGTAGTTVPLPGPFNGTGTATLTNNGNGTYTVHDEDAHNVTFDSWGNLLSVMDASGIGWTLTRPDANTVVVTHTNGQSFKLQRINASTTYGASKEIDVTDPAGNVYVYHSTTGWLDGIVQPVSLIGAIDSVTLPGSPSTVIGYQYLPDNTTSGTYAQLKEVDYNGVAHDVTTYDSSGRANMTSLADGNEKTSVVYGSNSTGVTATVTNPLGHVSVYQYNSSQLLVSVTGDASTHCAASFAQNTYDANGNMLSSTDNNGNVTAYNYGTTGLLQQKIEAQGSSVQRTTDMAWDTTPGTDRVLSTTIEGYARTAYTFDAHNRLASVTITNLSGNGTANQALTTNYSYALYADGIVQTLTVTHPSPNNSDVDTSQYDALGNLTSVTDGLGHTTTYGNYNGLGEPQTVTGPNGDVTNYTYDARGRVATKTTHANGVAATWTYGYDGFGLPASISAPDGEVIAWNRDSEMRVTTMTHNDKDGTSTETYGYDANNDVTNTTISRNGTGTYSSSTTYDELGRPYQVLGNNGQSLTYTYDGNANVLSVTDAAGHVTSYQYDALNRVTQKSESGSASPSMPSSAPALSAPTSNTNGNYDVSWGAVSGATYYVLQEQVNGGSWSLVQDSDATSYALTNQSSGTYSYRVQACNVSGCSSWSSAGQVVVLLAPSAAPSLSVPATVVGGVYTVSWSSVATATSYNLQEQFQGGAWAIVYSGSSVSWSATEKLPGTYGYQVQACNSTGCGPWSPVSTVNVSVDMSPIINLILDSN